MFFWKQNPAGLKRAYNGSLGPVVETDNNLWESLFLWILYLIVIHDGATFIHIYFSLTDCKGFMEVQ